MTDPRQAPAGRSDPSGRVEADVTAQETPLELNDLHWAGHGAGSCHELTPARKRRVYFDPKDRPDLFIVRDGEPPTRPLPVLDLDGHPQDPEPWLDPETGTRFTGDQARITTTLLKYAPRAEQPFERPFERLLSPSL